MHKTEGASYLEFESGRMHEQSGCVHGSVFVDN